MFGSSRYGPIGIDLGSADVKCAQFVGTNGSLRSWRLASLGSPQLVESQSRPHELARLLRSEGFRGGRAVVSLPSSRLEWMSLTVQAGAEDDLAAIRTEIGAHLSYPADEAVVDYVPLFAGQARSQSHQNVLVAAAPKVEVESLLDRLRSVRLRVEAIDTPPTALRRLATLLESSADAGPMAVVDIGVKQTTAIVVDHASLVCCRRIPLGGATFTAALQKALEISEADAEQVKLSQRSAPPESNDQPDGKVRETLREILRPALEAFAGEIQRLLRYFATQSKGKQVSQILLVGGSSRLEHLQAAVSEVTQVRAVTLDELDMPVRARLLPAGRTPDVPLGLFAVAAGLALRQQAI